jgi:hypothetical protein
MPRVLKVVAILFFLLAAAALTDGVRTILATHEARLAGPALTQIQFVALARQLAFIWLFAAIFGAIGLGLWQRRRLTFVLILLFATLVGQWMNVGYPNGFLLSLATLALLAAPTARVSFRD